MKKEAAADGDGEWEEEVLGAGSPAWLVLLSWQGVRVLVVLAALVVVVVTVAIWALEATTSAPASPVKPAACSHTHNKAAITYGHLRSCPPSFQSI